jgi:hypothetical protein
MSDEQQVRPHRALMTIQLPKTRVKPKKWGRNFPGNCFFLDQNYFFGEKSKRISAQSIADLQN